MSWEAWFAVAVVLLDILLLMFTRLAPDIVMVSGVAMLLLVGILTPEEALSGMANEGMITVGVMYVIVAGLRETGGVDWIGRSLFGRPRSLAVGQLRLMAPIAALSTFLNNTPLVAMMIPAVNDWAKRQRFPVSKFMLPLSYSAILGGTISLIGTSTNLVVSGLLVSETGTRLGFFEIAWLGIPCTVVGIAFILLVSRWLLPDRRPVLSETGDPREYTIEMTLEPGGPLIGKSIEEAGLRNLPNLFLAEIERQGRAISAVAPEEVLEEGDQLVFVGIVDSVVELRRIRGLLPATNQVFKLDGPRTDRTLIQAVVSDSGPLVGKSIRAGEFRSVYNAVVLAVARGGRRVMKKIGDIVLQPGDTLLLEARPSFAVQQRNSRDFYLISQVEGSTPPRHERAFIALAILIGMITVVTLGWLTMLEGALLAAGLMLVTRCLTGAVARSSVDWQVLIVIAASFGLGQAMDVTGAAAAIASSLVGLVGGSPWASLAVIYLVTMVFTEILSNNGAAVLMFPIALATAGSLDVSYMPFITAMMVAASFGFATPIGYQTNLMVYGPGGYKFSDYLRLGIPLDLLMGVVVVSIAPLVWPF
ncbi:MAG: Sulfate permease, Trk-type [uncultured Truepera sp.]|uniref:Sulfate permease, Trk-type n=1 Tax=uncultured Truepera sp. TaxID=543023 RepID=A0A6J4UUA6_9DEIN|nr:MAG: Sulfate permease, Trk-type [uncultured Truepera sp.]